MSNVTFSHFAFWQCSCSNVAGSLPVHEDDDVTDLRASGFMGVNRFLPFGSVCGFLSASGAGFSFSDFLLLRPLEVFVLFFSFMAPRSCSDVLMI